MINSPQSRSALSRTATRAQATLVGVKNATLLVWANGPWAISQGQMAASAAQKSRIALWIRRIRVGATIAFLGFSFRTHFLVELTSTGAAQTQYAFQAAHSTLFRMAHASAPLASLVKA